MSLTLHTVDAFTSEPFSGNPAGVCIVEKPLPDDLMQKIAAEMNLSETAFLACEKDGYHLRWFTPTVEVKLCGHATLASAHILFESKRLKPDETARFHTLSGILTARSVGGKIELDFPASAVRPATCPPEAIPLMGATPLSYHTNEYWQLAELDSEATVRNLKPNIRSLYAFGLGHLIVTAKATTPGLDIVSRVFVPEVGIDEDPVTGSAHCVLAPYWSGKLGKTVLAAYQASRRGGRLEIEHRGERVLLRGQAVTVMRAELRI
ncbi:PhzF family phenazine biosynthesis protein [bacterium]|nr:PhzF family phenazine biosynthesis protein [bacterium]MBU1984958.1 PhzF family phenazine biosynthesis protein [bacterium]